MVSWARTLIDILLLLVSVMFLANTLLFLFLQPFLHHFATTPHSFKFFNPTFLGGLALLAALFAFPAFLRGITFLAALFAFCACLEYRPLLTASSSFTLFLRSRSFLFLPLSAP